MAVRSQEQNLDPLLDTMANVVGILVVLVAVTQLSVSDAVDRISSRPGLELDVSESDLAQAAARAEAVDGAVVAASGQLEAYTPSEARRGVLLDELRPHVEAMETLEGRFDWKGVPSTDLAEQLESTRLGLERLLSTVDQSERRLSGLDALLADVPAELRPKVARLPDPRPPPSGSREIAYFVRYGRVAPFDLEGMKRMLKVGTIKALGDDRAVVAEDRPWLVNLFKKGKFGRGNFYWSIRDERGRAFFADVAWADPALGETAFDLLAKDSQFARELAELNRSGQFIRFYVWSDSFEAYLEARYVAESIGWNISWLAVDRDEEVGINLLGGSRSRILLD